MIEFQLGLQKILLYSWDTLYSYEYECYTNIEGVHVIIENQEKSTKEYEEGLIAFEKSTELPEQYRDSVSEDNFNRLFSVKLFQRYSSCNLLFSVFEAKLKDICDLIIQEFNIESYTGYNRGSTLKPYRKFLETTFGINFSTIDADWIWICNQYKIRNLFVHYEGILQKDICEYVIEQGCKIDSNRIIVEDIAYIQTIESKIKSFFKELYIQIDIQYKNKISI